MMDEHNTDPTESTPAGEHVREAAQVTIPDRVHAAIEGRVARTEFESTDEYVTFVLESLLRELDRQDGDAPAGEDFEAVSENSEAVENRLESLGYL